MVKKLVKSTLRPLLGKSGTQWVFESMRQLAMAGMNYGDSGALQFSGEERVVDHVTNSLAQRLPRESSITVFDVGANVGNYSLMLIPRMKRVFPKGRVQTFEPSGPTFATLNETLKGFDCVQFNQIAFSDQPGTSTLFQVFPGSGYASLFNREEGSLKQFGIKTAIKEEITLSTIDIFCKGNNVDHIHFLKIDTEGAELSVLKGAQSMLNNGAVDYIQFEFSEGCLDSRTYLKDFFELLGDRYRISRVLRNGLRVLPTYQAKFEVFACANYLAEKI